MKHDRKHTLSIVDEIALERCRQVASEGFDITHDDKYEFGELARAAACYSHTAGLGLAAEAGMSVPWLHYTEAGMPPQWPWALAWWKPKSPREDLVRAAALIVAQIEAIDRAASGKSPDGFNPHGSGPVPIDPRDAIPPRRAILEGNPSGMRADIAERCAKAGFVCTFLPGRTQGAALHITLIGNPGAGKSALLNAIADAGYALRERRVLKDRGESAEAAVIYGRNVAAVPEAAAEEVA